MTKLTVRVPGVWPSERGGDDRSASACGGGGTGTTRRSPRLPCRKPLPGDVERTKFEPSLDVHLDSMIRRASGLYVQDLGTGTGAVAARGRSVDRSLHRLARRRQAVRLRRNHASRSARTRRFARGKRACSACASAGSGGSSSRRHSATARAAPATPFHRTPCSCSRWRSCRSCDESTTLHRSGRGERAHRHRCSRRRRTPSSPAMDSSRTSRAFASVISPIRVARPAAR